jgi:hypothetical protein
MEPCSYKAGEGVERVDGVKRGRGRVERERSWMGKRLNGDGNMEEEGVDGEGDEEDGWWGLMWRGRGLQGRRWMGSGQMVVGTDCGGAERTRIGRGTGWRETGRRGRE